MNLFALFSKLYYVTIIHIILYLLFYYYLKFYKFTNLQILIKPFHINTIKNLQIFYIQVHLKLELELQLQLQFYNFTYIQLQSFHNKLNITITINTDAITFENCTYN